MDIFGVWYHKMGATIGYAIKQTCVARKFQESFELHKSRGGNLLV